MTFWVHWENPVWLLSSNGSLILEEKEEISLFLFVSVWGCGFEQRKQTESNELRYFWVIGGILIIHMQRFQLPSEKSVNKIIVIIMRIIKKEKYGDIDIYESFAIVLISSAVNLLHIKSIQKLTNFSWIWLRIFKQNDWKRMVTYFVKFNKF